MVYQWFVVANTYIAKRNSRRDIRSYNASIAEYAAANKRFVGGPNFNEKRMTWVKPNFLWAMYRSGWAKKQNQDRTESAFRFSARERSDYVSLLNCVDILAIWLKREGFEEMLRASKHSSEQGTCQRPMSPTICVHVNRTETEREEATKNGTRTIVDKSPNRIQWDPQHSPDGEKLRQRALQLGVKDPRYISGEWIVDIQDITEAVIAQRPMAVKKSYPWPGLMVPAEEVYQIGEERLARHLALDIASELK